MTQRETGLDHNVEDILARLLDSSRTELTVVRHLADAIRRVDEHLLREVRGVTMQHELRRAQIFGELQDLATRLCALPAPVGQPQHQHHQMAIDQNVAEYSSIDAVQNNGGGADWRRAAQNIDEELGFTFNGAHRH